MDIVDMVESLAELPIEDIKDVDIIPDLITTLHDVIDRLTNRWKEEFPGDG